MRICSKNPNHRRLGGTRCEVPGCGALVIEVPDPPQAAPPPVVPPPQHEPPPPEMLETEPDVVASDTKLPDEAMPAADEAALVPRAVSFAPETQTDSEPLPQADDRQPIVPPPEPLPPEAPPPLQKPHILSAGIDWPWGFAMLADYLPIGRDPAFSPLAARLRNFAGIADRHAEIHRRGTGFVLRDLGSEQGTFLAGTAISPHQDVNLANGAILRFGRQASARVRYSRL